LILQGLRTPVGWIRVVQAVKQLTCVRVAKISCRTFCLDEIRSNSAGRVLPLVHGLAHNTSKDGDG